MKMMTRQHSELFLNLKELNLTGIDGDEYAAAAAFPSNFLYGLHNLEVLMIQNSSLGEIFPYEEGQEEIFPFPSLPPLPHFKWLYLDNLSELKYICTQNSPFFPILNQLHHLYLLECPRLTNLLPTPSLSFKFLKELIVVNCGALINLIQLSTTASLEQLEWLIVRGCQMIEEIVAADDSQEDDHQIIIFSKLCKLELEELPKVTNFCTANNYTFKFPELREVIVNECPNMRTFSPGITIIPELQKVSFEGKWYWKGDLNTTIFFSQMEPQRLTTTDPSTSSNNHVKPEAHIHEKPIESTGKEAEEIFEEVTEPRKDGQICEDGVGELGKKPEISENVMKPENEIEVCEHVVDPREVVGFFEQCNEPRNGTGICEEVVEEGKVADSCEKGKGKEVETESRNSEDHLNGDLNTSGQHLYSEMETKRLATTDPSTSRKQTEICEGETWNHPRLKSNIEATNSQTVNKDFIPLLNKVTQILQTQPLNSMSAQQVQFMEDAFQDLSTMNFSIEWFGPFIEKARDCVSVAEREREISEYELKIAVTKALLQELEENKKALEDKNSVIASVMDLGKSVYDN